MINSDSDSNDEAKSWETVLECDSTNTKKPSEVYFKRTSNYHLILAFNCNNNVLIDLKESLAIHVGESGESGLLSVPITHDLLAIIHYNTQENADNTREIPYEQGFP